MKTKQYPPIPPLPTERRLTIPVSVEVYAVFERISKASNTPIGRSMGEWLGDTLDAAEFMAQKIEQARSAPSLVAKELHAYALGMSDMTTDLMQKLRESRPVQAAVSAEMGVSPALKAPTTPLSNTGGEPTGARKTTPRKKL